MVAKSRWTVVEEKDFYSIREVAKILGVDAENLRKKIIKGKRIAYHQDGPGSSIRIQHADLLEYIERNRVTIPNEKERQKK